MLLDFLFLYWLNLCADYPLQGDFIANLKGTNNYILFVHCAIWTGLITLGLVILGLFTWWKMIMLLLGHFIIDKWKSNKKDKSKVITLDLWIDQFLHVLQILICL